MVLPRTIEGREYKKFLQDNNGDTAVRVVVTSGLQNPVTDILLTNQDVDSGANVGTVVGTLVTQGGAGPYLYIITDDPEDKFSISGSDLITKNPISYVETPSLSVTIKVVDINDSEYTKGFNITVNQTPLPPFTNDFYTLFRNTANQFCSSLYDASYSGLSEFTLSAWVTPEILTGAHTIYSHFGAAGARAIRITQSGSSLFIGMSQNGSAQVNFSVPNSFVISQQQHLVVAFSGSGKTIKAWIDSVQVLDDVHTYDNLYDNTTVPLRVGARGDSSFPEVNYFEGYMDEISIYNNAFEQLRVDEIYNFGVPANVANMSTSQYLISWWRMGDGDTYPTLLDQIGSNDLTMNNMISGDIVNFNYSNVYSMNFNGVDQRIDTPLDLSGRTKFSISAYMYRNNATDRMDISQSNDANNQRVKLIRNTNGSIYVVIDSAAVQFPSTDTQWQHLVMVYDGTQVTVSDRIKLYIDAVAQAPSTSPAIPTSVGVIDKTLRIGQDNGSSNYSTGNFDEVSVWDIPLDQAQVTELYNSGVPLNIGEHSAVGDVISWWRLGDKVVGTVMPDQIGTSDGTLVNSPTKQMDTP